MKFKLLTLIITLGLILTASSVSAVTNITASPANIQVEEGESFTLSVTPNPGEEIYTVKINISYPSNLLEATSFEFSGNNWMPLSQAGYDEIDNDNGVIIKTAGYSGGTSYETEFGTITFEALSSGNATISFGGDTMVLDSSNSDVIGNTNSVSVAISSPEPVQVTQEEFTPTPEAEEEVVVTEISDEAVSIEETEEPESEEVAEKALEQTPATSSPVLTAATILTLGTGSSLVSVFVILIILAGAAFAYNKYLRKPKK